VNTQLPVAPAGYSQQFFNLLFQQLTRYFSAATSKDEQTPRVVLRSPNGSNYDLTFSDAATLVITPTSKTRT
jgi:hypothetical protein